MGCFFKGSQILGAKHLNGGKQGSFDIFKVKLGMGLGQRCTMKGGVSLPDGGGGGGGRTFAWTLVTASRLTVKVKGMPGHKLRLQSDDFACG
jgi:hypothetical protein